MADFTENQNADRRATFLMTATELLVTHIEGRVAAWEPDADNYRKDFSALPADEALVHIFTGIGELSRGEIAGERMNVAYAERSQEDEQSCVSDNTTADLLGNARGIEMVLQASYPGVSGTSILDVVAEVDHDLARRLSEELAATRSWPASKP